MLEHFYESGCRLQQLRQPPLGESIDALAGRFHQLGYTRMYGRKILWIVGNFNDYARINGIETAEGINESLMRRFAGEEGPGHGIYLAVAMRRLEKHLRDQGIVPPAADLHWDDPCETILREYDEHLCHVRGLAQASRSESRRYVQRFLIWLRSRHGDDFLDRINGVDVLEFITEFAGLHPSGSWRRSLCSYTRVFLRYLRSRGIIQVDLDRVVPRLPKWRWSNVPRHLPWEDVQKLIESVDTSKPVPVRTALHRTRPRWRAWAVENALAYSHEETACKRSDSRHHLCIPGPRPRQAGVYGLERIRKPDVHLKLSTIDKIA